MKHKPIIEFIASNPYAFKVVEKPLPASNYIPDWWRKMEPYIGGKFAVENLSTNASFKKCTPMLDALTSGYIVSLRADVHVTQTEFGPRISWRVKKENVFEPHAESAKKIATPHGYHEQPCKYNSLLHIKTPSGYSCLITQPFGYPDTPFQAISAIIDTDNSPLENLFPVWIQKDFEGVVEKGTPLVQITPFKRNDWESTYSFYEEGEYRALEDKTFSSTLINHYTKKVWSKKKYS